MSNLSATINQSLVTSPTHNALGAAEISTVLVGSLQTSHVHSRTPYGEYTQTTLAENIISGSLTIVNLFKDVANLIPHAGPLSQILAVTAQIIGAIHEMQDNKSSCEYLVERILKFLMNLAIEEANMPMQDGTSTAARLHVLLS